MDDILRNILMMVHNARYDKTIMQPIRYMDHSETVKTRQRDSFHLLIHPKDLSLLKRRIREMVDYYTVTALDEDHDTFMGRKLKIIPSLKIKEGEYYLL
jgi:hypothetical protein